MPNVIEMTKNGNRKIQAIKAVREVTGCGLKEAMDTERGTVQNLVYWLREPLDDETIAVLRRVERGVQRFAQDRLEVAYLVARDCVVPDYAECVLRTTAKGRDALAFFGQEKKVQE
jgi:hypothetical protein